MTPLQRARGVLTLATLATLIVSGAGCGAFSRSGERPPEVSGPANPAAPAATPAPPPPPPRPAGARIADEERLKSLIQGKTTKAEVRDLFGTPEEIVLGPGGETFIYHRDQRSGWFTRTSERVEMLTVRFDPGGILKDFEYRYSGK